MYHTVILVLKSTFLHFFRARLTPVVTEERVFLPSADELRAAEMEQALEVEPLFLEQP